MEVASQPADSKAMAKIFNLLQFTSAGLFTGMFIVKKLVVSPGDGWDSG